MNEKIVSIEEILDMGEKWCKQDGFRITTNHQKIELLIDSDQQCCENWGYFLSEDDIQRFVGADLLGVTVTDTERNKEKHVELYEGDALFVDIETSVGVLQFVAYNEHNGYYGHRATVVSEQLKYEAYL